MRAYLSHPIRGAKGAAATREDMEANNRRAIEFAAQVRAEFPGLDLYVPAEHDEFVIEAYEMAYLAESDILAIDVRLVQKRDMLITYAPESHISNGMRIEIEAAQAARKPIAFTTGGMDPIHGVLESFLHG